MDILPDSWPWISLALLGAFHGANPAMGWLFAVASGFQERRLRAVVAALAPISVGHAAAIGITAGLVGIVGLVIPQGLVLLAIGVILIGFAAYKTLTRFRHPRWVAMRAGPVQVATWSFLMATAHGAGLMLAPALAAMRGDAMQTASAQHVGHMDHMAGSTSSSSSLDLQLVGAVLVHSGAMLLVAGMLAVLIYRVIGVEILRRAWLNLDFLWTSALAVTGALTVTAGALSLTG